MNYYMAIQNMASRTANSKICLVVPLAVFFRVWTGQRFLAGAVYPFCILCGCHISKLLLVNCLVNAENIRTLILRTDLAPFGPFVRAAFQHLSRNRLISASEVRQGGGTLKKQFF